MKLPEKLENEFGLLDIKKGRQAFYKYFQKKDAKPIKVTIQAEIVSAWSGDDGVSREFELAIKTVKVKQP